ncbi:MAG: translocation/assembly module TamB domain-containing protein, partial [Acidobacteriota bacterium]|nr:translocation/assembly module TamB domain-containing protein [Acidobacteriota bacterium]
MGGTSTGRRLLKWVIWCVLAVALVIVLVVVGVELALKSRTVRAAITSRLVPWVEREYGVGVELEDFSLSPLGGSLELRDLALRAGAATPFARVERIRAQWQPLSLLGGHPYVRELVVDRPAVDLGQPLPTLPEKAPSEPSSPPALSIERIRVTEASLDAGVPEGVADVLREWMVRKGDMEASLDGDRFAVTSATAGIGVDLVRAGALDLEVAVEADGRLGGDIEIRSARVSSAPLELDASGRVGAGERDISGTFTGRTDAGFWLGHPDAAPVTVEGTVDLGAWTGGAQIRAPEVSGELFRELVASDLFDQLEIAATSFGLETDIELFESDGVAARVRLAATREGSAVLLVSGEPRVRLLETLPVASEISVELLPGLPGARRVTAAVEGEELRKPEQWTVTRGSVAVDSPDVDRLLAAMARLWPRLVPATALADLPALGKLAATGSFSGVVTDPRLESKIDWRPHADGLVRATVSGHLRGTDLTLESEGSAISLAHFTDAASGRLEWSGSARGGLENPQGGIHAAIWDLVAGGETVFDALDVRVSGGRRNLEWALDGSSPTIGILEGKGSVVPESILARAAGRLTLTPVAGATGGGIDLVDSSFELADGALVLEARGFGAGREIAVIDARMPLAEVARIPGAEAVATLPLLRSEGAVEVEWRVPTGDWVSLLPEGMRSRVARLEAGSAGRIELDVDCPACSRVSGEVLGLIAEVDGRSISSDEPLALSLADGRLRLAPWAVDGDDLTLSINGEADLSTEWRPGSDPAELIVQSRLEIDGELGSTWLESLPLDVVTPGAATLHIEAGGPAVDWSGKLTLAADTLVVASPSVPGLAIAAPHAEITLAAGEVRIDQLGCNVGEGSLTAEGRLWLDDPLREATGRVRLEGALPVVEQIELPFEIRDGLLSIVEGAIGTPGGRGNVGFQMSLAETAGATVQLEWSVPRNDWTPLLGLFGVGEDPESLQFGSRGEVTVDLENPTDASAAVVLDEAGITMRGRTTFIETPIALTLADAQLTVAPFTLVSDAGEFVFQGRSELTRGWTTSDSFAALVSRFELDGHGAIDSGLLNPFLAGGRASGPLGLDLKVAGSPSDYSGTVRLAGPDAEILYRSPYLTRLSKLELDLVVAGDRITVERGGGILNEGSLQLAGVLSEEGRTDLEIRIDDALFRLDYGLLTSLDGDLRYRAGADGSALVSGGVTVERGSLTRNIQLDYDLLTQLLAPIDLTTTEDDPLELIKLDMSVRTREGVRVKNNVGDLLVRWEPLAVTGSVAKPIIEGNVEVDPGGLLYAYGQTVRLDRAVIEYPGEEDAEPRLDFEATTSLDDPTIGQLSGGDPFRKATVEDESAGPAAGEVTADLARYYGEQFAGRVGESVGVSVSLRPLLIFGETDPGAR